MSLFGPIYVTSVLTLSRKQENALIDAAGALGLIGEHTHGIQIALDAIVAKLNEPQEPPPTDQQPAIDALVAKLAESNTTLAEEVAKILAANPTQSGA